MERMLGIRVYSFAHVNEPQVMAGLCNPIPLIRQILFLKSEFRQKPNSDKTPQKKGP